MRPGAAVPEPRVVQTLVQAFGTMQYDLGILSDEESRLLERHELELKGWSSPGSTGRVVFFASPLGRVAVISLPPLASPFVLPNQQMIELVNDLTKSVRPQADLIVAISPWGPQGERFLLEKTAPDIDILLGAGPGPGVAGQLANRGRTVWARPYDRGQTVTRIIVRQMLGAAGGRTWVQGGNIEFRSVPLFKEIPEDQGMNALFSGLS
jgi:hypothetical protein